MSDPQPVRGAGRPRAAACSSGYRAGAGVASKLAAELPITRQAIATHLALLDEAGLVARVRHGREVQYRVRPEALDDVTSWVARVGARWEERLEKLKRSFE